MKSKIAAAALVLLPLTGQYALAEDAAPKKPVFDVSAELGFLFKTGNTHTGDIKAGINVKHENGKWLNLLDFNALAKKARRIDEDTAEEYFETTDNKWDLTGQTNYSIGDGGKNYLYGNAYYKQDKFSSFLYQTSVSLGWGRHWFEDETSSLFADIGPGVKYDVLRAEPAATPAIIEHGETAAIIQAQALYTHKINDFVEFKQYFVAKQAFQSEDNSVYKSETSLTTKLIESLQFKFAIRLDYDTKVEEGFENLNTETSVTLVYSF